MKKYSTRLITVVLLLVILGVSLAQASTTSVTESIYIPPIVTFDIEFSPQQGADASAFDADRGAYVQQADENGEWKSITPCFVVRSSEGDVVSTYPGDVGEWAWDGTLSASEPGDYAVTATYKTVELSASWVVVAAPQQMYNIMLIPPQNAETWEFNFAQNAYYPQINPDFDWEKAGEDYSKLWKSITPNLEVQDIEGNEISCYPGGENGWTWSGNLSGTAAGNYIVTAAKGETTVSGSWSIIEMGIMPMVGDADDLLPTGEPYDGIVADIINQFRALTAAANTPYNGSKSPRFGLRLSATKLSDTPSFYYEYPGDLPDDGCIDVMGNGYGFRNSYILPADSNVELIGNQYVTSISFSENSSWDLSTALSVLPGFSYTGTANLAFFNQAFSFVPQPVIATYLPAKTIVYGESVPSSFTDYWSGSTTFDSFAATVYSGYRADDVTVPKWKTDISNPSSIGTGTYTMIDIVGKENSNFSTTWYTIINPTGGTLNVTPKGITIVINDKTITYGDLEPTDYEIKSIDGAVYGQELSIDGATISRIGNTSLNAGYYDIDNLTGGTIKADGSATTNYKVTTITPGKLTISPKNIDIQLPDATKTYGDNDPDFGQSGYAPWTTTVNATGVAGDSLTVSGMLKRVSGENAGDYKIEWDGEPTVSLTNASVTKSTTLASQNYSINYIDGTFSITPKTVDVKVKDYTKEYGEADPDFKLTTGTMTVEGVRGETLTIDEIITRPDKSENVGVYSLVIEAGNNAKFSVSNSGLSSNYRLNVEGGNLEITKKALKVSIADAGKTYGDADPIFMLTGASDAAPLTVPVTLADSTEGTLTLEGVSIVRTAGENVNATPQDYPMTLSGTLSFTLVGDVATNYSITVENGWFAISPKSVQVKVETRTITYGDTIPTGFGIDQSDAAYALSAQAEFTDVLTVNVAAITRDDATNTNAGNYKLDGQAMALSVNGGDSANYTLTIEDGALVIEPKEITVSVADDSKTYMEDDPDFWLNVGGSKTLEAAGISGETLVVEHGGFERESGETVPGSTYEIDYPDTKRFTVTGGNENADNYTLVVIPGELTINKLVVDAEKPLDDWTYNGDKYDEDGIEEILPGDIGDKLNCDDGEYEIIIIKKDPVNGDTVVDEISDAGDYEIIVKIDDNTYENVSFPGDDQEKGFTVTVSPKNIAVTIDSYEKTYGEDDPTFKLVNGIGEDGLSYPTGNAGETLVIKEAIIRKNTSNHVGDRALSFDDDQAVSFDITGGKPSNYTVTVTDGNLKIKQKDLTIKIDDDDKVYGDSDPAFTLVNGTGDNGRIIATGAYDEEITLTCNIIRAEGENVEGGSLADGKYEIDYGNPISFTVSNGGEKGNYNITWEKGVFDITPRPITITIDNATKVYGDNDSAATGYPYKLVDGEGDGKIRVPTNVNDERIVLETAITRKQGENVGKYGITSESPRYTITSNANRASTPKNYEVTLNDGVFEITPKLIEVTIDNATKKYGEKDPAFALAKGAGNDRLTVATGVDSETLTVSAGQFTRVAGENVVGSPYTISYKDATVFSASSSASNYTLTVLPGALMILPREVDAELPLDPWIYDGTEYDDEKLDDILEGTITDLIMGDNDDYTITITDENGNPVDNIDDAGDYTITVTLNDPENTTFPGGGESVTFPATVWKKPLIVYIDSYKKVSGQADPAFALKNGTGAGKMSNPTGVAGQTVNITEAIYRTDKSEAVGSYPLIFSSKTPSFTITGGKVSNYTVEAVFGTLEITKKPSGGQGSGNTPTLPPIGTTVAPTPAPTASPKPTAKPSASPSAKPTASPAASALPPAKATPEPIPVRDEELVPPQILIEQREITIGNVTYIINDSDIPLSGISTRNVGDCPY